MPELKSAPAFSADGLAIEGGFAPGFIYELVYTARDPLVTGLGFAAIRDVASCLENDPDCPAGVERTVALGISQTGRFLRHMLWQGFVTDTEGRPTLDGVLAMTAGAGRGSFNHRFGQPSRDAHAYSAFFYPTDLFPFTSALQEDPVGGRFDGLFARQHHPDHLPRVFLVNTGYEYWGRASGSTTSPPPSTTPATRATTRSTCGRSTARCSSRTRRLPERKSGSPVGSACGRIGGQMPPTQTSGAPEICAPKAPPRQPREWCEPRRQEAQDSNEDQWNALTPAPSSLLPSRKEQPVLTTILAAMAALLAFPSPEDTAQCH